MNTGVSYKLFSAILLDLREDFHSFGRIDDSNMKLDEIVKLLMLSYFLAKKGQKFSLSLVKAYAQTHHNDENAVAISLRDMFNDAVKYPLYRNIDGTSIFGANPALNIQPSDNLFSEKIISEIEKIDFLNLVSHENFSDFDILNECFGHFVRENFRNNKEDAQYMTPAEITLPILSVVFDDFIKEGYFERITPESFTIMDPTCGVGTLLIAAARMYVEYLRSRENSSSESIIENFYAHSIIGQDKVDRMVRLTKINSLLLGINSQNIYIGNSISEDSCIDKYKGKVDFIFTNPPFGAQYLRNSINEENFDNLKCLFDDGELLNSEVLMLLKCTKLLKPDGKLAIVLPDSVFSAKGLIRVRKFICDNYKINAIFQMPSVTFAQAGTRTNTSVLYLTKTHPDSKDKIIMGVCEDVGYVVKERNGVPIKIKKGKNQMDLLAKAYIGRKPDSKIVLESPSVTSVQREELIDGILTPSFYSSDRFQTLHRLETSCVGGYEMRELSDIVRFETIGRKNLNVTKDIQHISVLHINPDCTIDFQQVRYFEPISKGRICHEGDILFSKINPRIPRMTVVPNYEKTLVCSNEFEIMRPKVDIGAYVICLLLKTSYVAKQIENLTSGTSSSHSRIKREQLSMIKIPVPKSTTTKALFQAIDEEIKKTMKTKYEADRELIQKLDELEKLF